jgi:hypothetical protein
MAFVDMVNREGKLHLNEIVASQLSKLRTSSTSSKLSSPSGGKTLFKEILTLY